MINLRTIAALVAVIFLLASIIVVRELQHKIKINKINAQIEATASSNREAQLRAEVQIVTMRSKIDSLRVSIFADSIEAAGYIHEARSSGSYASRRAFIPTASDSALANIIKWER